MSESEPQPKYGDSPFDIEAIKERQRFLIVTP